MNNQRNSPIETISAEILLHQPARSKRHNPFLFMALAAVLLVSMTQVGCTGLTSANTPAADPTTTTTVAVAGATGSFGSVATGTSATQTFTVSNSGTVTLTITALAASGSGFSVSGFTLPITVNPGQATSFAAKFSPTTAGAVTGSISITANTSPAVSTIALSGAGTGSSQPAISTNPTSFDFGNIPMGTSSTRTVTISNTGSAALSISNITAAGPGFSVSGFALPISIPANQSISITAKFTPTASGPVGGNFSIANNSPASSMVVQMTGTGTSQPQPQSAISTNPASFDFGNIAVGTSTTRTVTISNTGTAALNISNITAAGPGFSVSGFALPISVPASQSTTITAKFTPTASGPVGGNITIANDSPTPSTVVQMTGTGTSQAQPAISVNPASVTFGSVTVGVTSSQTVTISNTGNAALSISNIVAAGSGFSVTGFTLPVSVAAGQSTTISAKFIPSVAGAASGSITITNNSGTPSDVVALSGTGTAVAQAAISVSPSSVPFGNVNTGASGSQTLTISNTGNATLTISNITASGTGYSVSGFALPVSVAAGQTSTFSAKFAPTVTGLSSGNVTIASNAPTSPTNVGLTGTGVQGQLTANPGTVPFGNVAVGATGSQTITLTNGGSSAVTISQASVTGTGFTISGITTPLTIGTGLTSTFTATLTPTASGAASGTVTLTSNAPNPTTTITLTGTGTQPTMVLTPSTVTFGNVTVGAPNSQTIQVKNTGNGALTISSATASGAGFSMNGLTTPATIAAGSSTTFNVAFGPAVAGAVTGSISLVSNAPGSPTAIALTGTGVAATRLLGGSSSSLTFASVTVGSNSSQTVTLTNSGNSTVTVASVGATGTGFTTSGVVAQQMIAAGQTATLTVTFTPASAATVSGTVTVTSNATNSPVSIALSGTGTQPVSHSVSLSWTASTSTVVGYNVYRSTISGGPYTLITSSAVAGTSYTDSTVQAGVTYFYVITAVDSNGNESAFSNEASATVPTP